jgi:uncharacterized membrane protein YdjX (TVP38/TMEM64 family)
MTAAMSMFVPISLMIAAGVLVFSPLKAFFLLYTTGLLASCLSFAFGRWVGIPPMGKTLTRGTEKLRNHLQRGGFLAVLVARLLPVGNFSAINLFAGAVGVPFVSYILANAVGLLPGLLLVCLFSGRVAAVWNDPNPWNIAAAVGALLLLVGVLWAIRKLVQKRVERKRAHEESRC